MYAKSNLIHKSDREHFPGQMYQKGSSGLWLAQGPQELYPSTDQLSTCNFGCGQIRAIAGSKLRLETKVLPRAAPNRLSQPYGPYTAVVWYANPNVGVKG